MGEVSHMVPSSVAAIPVADNGKKAGLSFKVYQELKSSVHRDLLNKIDVEKVATVRDERTRSQALAVIQDQSISVVGRPRHDQNCAQACARGVVGPGCCRVAAWDYRAARQSACEAGGGARSSWSPTTSGQEADVSDHH